MASPQHVFDAGQVLLGTFDEAEVAHRFAHDASRIPGTRLPVTVEDLAERTSRLIWSDRCHSVRWMALHRADPCAVSAVSAVLVAPAVPAVAAAEVGTGAGVSSGWGVR